MLSEELAGGTSHIAKGYIPPPWEELSYINDNVTIYLEELELRTQLQQRMRNVPWHEYKKLTEDVEIMLRNVCLYIVINNNSNLRNVMELTISFKPMQ